MIPGHWRQGVVFHWNGPPMRLGNKPHAACEGAVRAIQAYHQRKWSDVAYSWMFCNHGVIFECRGANWNQFANGADDVGEHNGGDRSWYTAMWLGGIGEEPSADAIQAAEDIVAAVRFVGAGSRVLPHSDFKHKTCPGPSLTSLARRMDNQALIPPAPRTEAPAAAEGIPEIPLEEDQMYFVLTSIPTLDGNGAPAVFQIHRDPVTRLLFRTHVTPDEWAVLSAGHVARLVGWDAVSKIVEAPPVAF
jgi:hypothetical protein